MMVQKVLLWAGQGEMDLLPLPRQDLRENNPLNRKGATLS
jgi:hypothetical protein